MEEDKVKFRIWLNPLILFGLVWSFTLLIYFTNKSEFVEDSSVSSILYCIALVLTIVFCGFPKNLSGVNMSRASFYPHKRNVRLVGWILVPILLLEVFAEVSYFGTLPFMASVAFSDDVDYNIVGAVFKFRHNIFVKANSIFLAGYFFLLYRLKRSYISLTIVILTVVITLMYVSRSTLISIFSVLALIYLISARVSLKSLFVAGTILILLAYGFDKLYFLRNMGDKNFMDKYYEDLGFFDSVMRGLDGVKNYVSSPVSNFLYNLENGTFESLEWRPSYLLRPFFPKTVGDFLFGALEFDNSLVFPNRSNTYTTFPHVLFSLGKVGALVFFSTFLGFSLKFLYELFRRNPHRWLLLVIFVNHLLILTIFSSSLFNMVYYFPVVMSFLLPPVTFVTNK